MNVPELRMRLYQTLMQLASEASTARRWEAASAFEYAANLALTTPPSERANLSWEPTPQDLDHP